MRETSAAKSMTDVWIDTDPSIGVPFHEADDGFALIQAFHSPELRIRGISTTYGNAGLATTTRIAREMAARFGGPAGIDESACSPRGGLRARPWQTHRRHRSPPRRGGRTPADLPRPRAADQPCHAADAPPRSGPAHRTGHLRRRTFAGGTRFRAGRWNPYEFTDGNFHKDHAAAAILLAVGPPLTLVPVELALRWLLLPRELARIGREGGAAGRYLAHKARLWMKLWRLCFAVRGRVVFDCLAVLAATHPHLLENERRYVSITRDPRAHAPRPSAQHPSARQPRTQRPFRARGDLLSPRFWRPPPRARGQPPGAGPSRHFLNPRPGSSTSRWLNSSQAVFCARSARRVGIWATPMSRRMISTPAYCLANSGEIFTPALP